MKEKKKHRDYHSEAQTLLLCHIGCGEKTT